MPKMKQHLLLEVGLEIDGAVYTGLSLRPACLADAYGAAALVAIPDDIATDTRAKVAYEMQVEDVTILHQIDSIDGVAAVPAVETLLAMIDPGDMALVRKAAEAIKKKLRLPKNDSLPADVPSTSLSAQDSL